MEALSKLYNKIIENNISLFDYIIPNNIGATVEMEGSYGIFVDFDKIETLYDEFKCVAHEYGHCISGSTHKLMSKFDLIEKHEYRANKSAILELLPSDKIDEAINAGCKELWEISEYLDMPQDFVEKAINFYKHANTSPLCPL